MPFPNTIVKRFTFCLNCRNVNENPPEEKQVVRRSYHHEPEQKTMCFMCQTESVIRCNVEHQNAENIEVVLNHIKGNIDYDTAQGAYIELMSNGSETEKVFAAKAYRLTNKNEKSMVEKIKDKMLVSSLVIVKH